LFGSFVKIFLLDILGYGDLDVTSVLAFIDTEGSIKKADLKVRKMI